jgi:hypothetical protein
MRELIDERTTHLIVNVLAVALPVAGLLLGTLAGALRRRLAWGAGRGLAVGCIGIANWLLWQLYHRVTDHYGLDSVKGLLINLGLFLGIGVAAGALGGLWVARKREARREA